MKTNRLTILESLQHPQLFGMMPAFKDLKSWQYGIVALKCVYGLPLANAEELRIFRHCTGRFHYNPPFDGYPELVLIVGRQGGKDRLTSLIAVFEAITRQPEPDGTDVYIVIVGQDSRGAQRTTFNYIKAFFELIPALAEQVDSITQEGIRLKNGVVIVVYPCRSQAVRGVRAGCAILNEFGFFVSTENIPQDKNMLQAIRPTLATTGGKLIILSSPYAQAGALFDLYRMHYGKEESSVLIWKASAPEMNPTLPKNYLERMQLEDPEAYASEVLGEFRAGLSTFIDPATLETCVDREVRERLPQGETVYCGFVDAASGTGKDAFTVGIAHGDGDKTILDVVRAWRAPFNPSGVIAEAAELFKRYGVHEVQGDKYAPGFVSEGFRANGITYTYSDHDRSGIYLELLPLLNSGKVVLLDHSDLLRELRGLERRRGTSGRDRVDHRPGSHDDLANSAAGCLVMANKPACEPWIEICSC